MSRMKTWPLWFFWLPSLPSTITLLSLIYKERLEKGMVKMAANGYCMHKILRIIYGMLKTNRAFDPEIDRINRIKNIQPRKKTRKDKIRKYQDYDAKAPVSRRQKKKRREQKESQSDKITESGIIVSTPWIHITDTNAIVQALPNCQRAKKKLKFIFKFFDIT